MNWSTENINLAAEKIELDAFLTQCLEMQVREDLAERPPRRDVAAEAVSGDNAGEASGGSGNSGLRVDPAVEPEAAAAAEPVLAEAPSVQPGPAESPAEGREEGAPEIRVEAEAETEKPAPAFRGFEPQKTEAAEKASDLPEHDFEFHMNQPDPVPPPEIVSPKTHFGPEDRIVMESPPSAPPDVKTSAQTDFQPKTEAKPAVFQDRSSLRRPSKNAAAIVYAREQKRRKKRLFTAVGIFIAFLLGVAVFLYVYPAVGFRSLETEIVTGSSQEQVQSGPADAVKEVGRKIHKKITRD